MGENLNNLTNEQFVKTPFNYMDLTRYNKDRENPIIHLTLLLLIGLGFVFLYTPYGFIDPEDFEGRIAPSIGYNLCVFLAGYTIEAASWIIKFNTQFGRANTWWKFIIFNIVLEVVLESIAAIAMAFNMMNCVVPIDRIAGRIFLLALVANIIPYGVTLFLFAIREKNYTINQMANEIERQNDKKQNTAEGNEDTTTTTEIAPILDTCMFYNLNGRFAFSCKRDNLLYLESNDNYVNVHYLNNGQEEHTIIHNTLKNLEITFANHGMIRCHRSYLVNRNKIKSLRRQKDSLVIELEDTESTIPVSKTYQDSVMNSLYPSEN